MRIGVAAWERDELESHELGSVIRRMGHGSLLFTLDDVACLPGNDGMIVTVGGQSAEQLDVVVSRVQMHADRFAALLDRLHVLATAVPIVDNVDAVLRANSKLLTMQRLQAESIPTPATALTSSVETVRELWARFDGIVVKPSAGHRGSDVERVLSDFEASRPMIQSLLARHRDLLVQPYVPHPNGDLRVIVVGGRVMGHYRRIPPDGVWKTTVGPTTKVTFLPPTSRIEEIGAATARAMDLEFAGLDMIETADDYVVVEVNTVPGLTMFEPDRRARMLESFVEQATLRARR